VARQAVAKSTLAGMSELWLPGGVLDIDDFVRRVHQQVERFAEAQGLAQAMVEVELRDGAHYVLDAIAPEPGYGFVTLRPHGTDSEEPQELIVPLATVTQIRISPAEDEPQFGFALPDKPAA
jgi:hypothetical protein